MYDQNRAQKRTAQGVERLYDALQAADAVLIGAGAGLSTAAGFTYTGARFTEHFADFIEAYGFTDMYSGGFYRFATPEEHWAYWSRYIFINRYQDAPVPVYEDLLALVQGKDAFVLTTNVDHCFQKAGGDKTRLFYTQGDYGLWQCSVPCHDRTYDNESVVRQMVAQQRDRRVPSALLPRCPVCGKPMSMNLRADATFVEDAGWHAASQRYTQWLRQHSGARILFLELGVGYNTPGIIKVPFWQYTALWPRATYACVNVGDVSVPGEIQHKSICIQADIAAVLQALRQGQSAIA